MIIKKIVVDGQEINVSITKEEAVKALKNHETLVFTDEKEKEEVYEALNPKEEKKPEPEVKKKSKHTRLMSILPFLEDEDIHDLMVKVLADDETVKDLNLVAILPFLSEGDADELFFKAIENNNLSFNPVAIAPFVTENALSRVVDLYIEGKLEQVNVDGLYPFLSSKDVKRLFEYILKQ